MAKDTKTDTASTGSNPFGDLSTMLEQFKVPGVDMSSFIDARRKDVQALVEANRAAYEAMQALARTQSDMLTQAMQGIQESAKGLTGGNAGMPDAAKQAEGARERVAEDAGRHEDTGRNGAQVAGRRRRQPDRPGEGEHGGSPAGAGSKVGFATAKAPTASAASTPAACASATRSRMASRTAWRARSTGWPASSASRRLTRRGCRAPCRWRAGPVRTSTAPGRSPVG